MRTREWKRLVTGVITDDEWRISKTLAYRVPVGWNLYGVLGEGSPSSTGFYLWVVRMPLFVPTDVVDLSWSERFGGASKLYTVGEPETERALRLATAQVRSEASSPSVVLDAPGQVANVLMEEAHGYALLLDGDAVRAVRPLAHAARYKARYDWEQAFVQRAQAIRSLIEQDQVAQALHQLETWRHETMSALSLTDSRD